MSQSRAAQLAPPSNSHLPSGDKATAHGPRSPTCGMSVGAFVDGPFRLFSFPARMEGANSGITALKTDNRTQIMIAERPNVSDSKACAIAVRSVWRARPGDMQLNIGQPLVHAGT